MRRGDDSFTVRIRSMVGLIPLFSILVLEDEVVHKLPGFKKRFDWFLANRKDISQNVSPHSLIDLTINTWTIYFVLVISCNSSRNKVNLSNYKNNGDEYVWVHSLWLIETFFGLRWVGKLWKVPKDKIADTLSDKVAKWSSIWMNDFFIFSLITWGCRLFPKLEEFTERLG